MNYEANAFMSSAIVDAWVSRWNNMWSTQNFV